MVYLVICITFSPRPWRMSWRNTLALNHAHLELSDKGNAIKGLVVCYVVWLRSMINVWFVDQHKVCGSGSHPLL